MSTAVVAVVAVAVVAAAASAYATYSASQAQAAAADYQQDVAENQAIAARQAADVRAKNEEEQHRRILAAQRARLGAAGVQPQEGSPLLVQMESAEQAALERARIRYAGAIQATGFQSEGILQGFYGKTARRQGLIGAGASLLGGVSNAAAGYYGTRSRTTTDGGTV